ncbi:hypothetical protein XELAEV_18028197mg [Xenopus laevis]|nr:hypothetical protein XELAEV_18028197mg [Xenopus laevis]
MITDIHNNFRINATPTAMNMLKMVWNDEVAKTAKDWAKTCSLNHSSPDLRKITNFTCGENLFMSSYPASWREAITAWFNEYKDFEYGKGAKTPKAVVGHYTQLMWYNTRLVACYVTECPAARFRYFYVCQYSPAGNIKGKENTPYKAGPTCGDCPKSCENGLCTNYCPYRDQYSNCGEFIKSNGCKDFQKICPAACSCTNNEIK